MSENKFWILYDGRAEFQDTEDCVVLETCGSTAKEVRSSLENWDGHDAVLFEYDTDGKELKNGRMVGHLRDGIKEIMGRAFGQKPRVEGV